MKDFCKPTYKQLIKNHTFKNTADNKTFLQAKLECLLQKFGCSLIVNKAPLIQKKILKTEKKNNLTMPSYHPEGLKDLPEQQTYVHPMHTWDGKLCHLYNHASNILTNRTALSQYFTCRFCSTKKEVTCKRNHVLSRFHFWM